MNEILEEHVKNVSNLSGTFDGLEMLKIDNPDSGKIFAGNMYIAALNELKKLRAERDDYKRQAELYHRDMMNVRAQRDKECAERDEMLEAIEWLTSGNNGLLWLGNNLHNYGGEQFLSFLKAAIEDSKDAQKHAAVVAKHNSPRG